MVNKSLERFFTQNGYIKNYIIEFTNKIDGETITFNNEYLFEDKFSITENLCSSECLEFGSCEASEINFSITYIGQDRIRSLVGEPFTVELEIYDNIGDIGVVTPKGRMNIGSYIVAEDKHDDERVTRTFKAYDKLKYLSELDVTDWYLSKYPSGTNSVSLKSLRDSFFDGRFGVLQDTSTSLVCDSLMVDCTIDKNTGTMLGGDFLKALCEINGVFGHMGRDGRFYYVSLEAPSDNSIYPSETLYPSETTYPGDSNVAMVFGSIYPYEKCTYEDFVCKKIDCVQVCAEDGDIGGSYPQSYTPTNGYKIIGNMFAIHTVAFGTITTYQSILNEIARLLKNKFADITYMPMTLSTYGDPCIEVGDIIKCNTVGGNVIVVSYVLQRKLDGIQALKDSYESQGKEYTDHNIKDNEQKQVEILRGKANVLIRTVDKMSSTIYDSQGESKIDQNARSITAAVTQTAYTGNTYDERSSIDIGGDASKDVYYTIKYRHASEPSSFTFNPAPSNGDQYLNTSNGKLYKYNSTTHSWAFVATLTKLTYKMTSQFKITSSAIEAKVSKNYTDSGKTFGWYLASDRFLLHYGDKDDTKKRAFICTSGGIKMYANGSQVANLDSTGLNITGKVIATSGNIGSGTSKWVIGSDDSGNSCIYSVKTKYASNKAGIYLGVDGISLGDKNNYFKVSKDGKVSCIGATISGDITATSGTIGGCKIVGGKLQINSADISEINANKITTGSLAIGGATFSFTSGGTAKYSSGTFTDSSISGSIMRTAAFTTDNINAKFTGTNWLKADNIKVGQAILMDWDGRSARAFKPVAMNGYYVFATPVTG